MANGHGGARPGAGRPSKAKQFAAEIEATEVRIAGKLSKALKNIEKLANGGYERPVEVWKPAGLMQVVRTEVVETEKGPKILRHMEPAFPGVPATTMVCIDRKVEVADPDLRANVYYVDRILGKPGILVETEEAAPSELPEDLEGGIMKIWEVKDELDEMFDFEEELSEIEQNEAIAEDFSPPTFSAPQPAPSGSAVSF